MSPTFSNRPQVIRELPEPGSLEEEIASPPHTRTGKTYNPSDPNSNPPGPPTIAEGNNKHFPFMTMGNYLVKKPIELEDIDRIVKNCPKPTAAPLGTLNYLKKACKGRNYTQEDMRLIIDGIIGPRSEWDWTKVPSINTIQIKQEEVDPPPPRPPPPSNPLAGQYALNTEVGVAKMWEELENEMKRVFKQKSSLSTALACKQKKDEPIPEYWKRFHDCWVQEAGLKIQDNDQLFISTFLINTLPHLVTPIKQMVSSWPSDTVPDFQKHLFEKEAAGCFEIKKPTISTHHFTDKIEVPQYGRGMSRGRGRGYPSQNRNEYGRGRNQRDPPQPRYPQGTCYNCGDPNHWARDCPRPRKNYQPQNNSMSTEQQPQATLTGNKFPINWSNQQQQR